MNSSYVKAFLRDNKKILLLLLIIFLSLGLFYYILFINPNSSNFFKSNQPTPTPIKDYPSLDSALDRVMNSDNPKEAAEKENLAVEGDSIKALITLKDDSFVFTSIYGKQYLQYGKNIQAAVKLDKLKELAENPKIESIKAPLKSKKLQ